MRPLPDILTDPKVSRARHTRMWVLVFLSRFLKMTAKTSLILPGLSSFEQTALQLFSFDLEDGGSRVQTSVYSSAAAYKPKDRELTKT